jgi:hypothetical protein
MSQSAAASLVTSVPTLTSSIAQATEEPSTGELTSAHHASPLVAFIIGLAIILLASILNAAGLNITKLDHVSSYDVSRLNSNLIYLICRYGLAPFQSQPAGETGYDRCGS